MFKPIADYLVFYLFGLSAGTGLLVAVVAGIVIVGYLFNAIL